MNMNPMLLCDFYKVSHRELYKGGTQKVYSTWTCRGSRMKQVDKTVFFGLQKFVSQYLIDYFQENFFNRPLEEVVAEYKRVIQYALNQPEPDTTHIERLWNLGYLPLKIKAVKEGTLVPVRVPCITIENTKEEFFWITNFVETLMSCELWQSITSATIAREYRKITEQFARFTCDDNSHVGFQCHDFSMRGMSSLGSAINSGIGHLTSFEGTDTIPAILALEKYYGADIEKELVGTSIPASEHSISCSYGEEEEFEYYRNIIKNVHPSGYVSLVSDTWNLWRAITEYVAGLKEDILARDGKVVIRPDSGNPVDILCGTMNKPYHVTEEDMNDIGNKIENLYYLFDEEAWDYMQDTKEATCSFYAEYQGKIYEVSFKGEFAHEIGSYTDNKYQILDCISKRSVKEIEATPEQKGVIELLWDIFGGTINEQGYKVLDSHIGAIYGDSITLDRCYEICHRLEEKGFASSNIVFGVGSFTYQYNTRDTFAQALKATYAVIDGEEKMLFKDPITDDGTKRSQRGKVLVYEEDGIIKFQDGYTEETIKTAPYEDIMEDVYVDGELVRFQTLSEIRGRIKKSL